MCLRSWFVQAEGERTDELEARIIGVKDTPFAGGVFKLKISVSRLRHCAVVWRVTDKELLT
jgi:hypothetical protein